ncbi:MAG: hypothetical protein JMDDDDMK_00388 [Acidobacteria bacterium]|nr:hypothetical protein [Acidobacteriota bacterium]
MLARQPHQVHEISDDHRREDFKESFDPHVNHRPAPEISDHEIGLRPRHKARDEEQQNRDDCVKHPVRQRPRFFAAQRRADAAPHNHGPERERAEEQRLPQPPQLDELPALIAQPSPPLAEHPLRAEQHARAAASHDDNQQAEERVDERQLPFRLLARDQRQHENRRADPAGRNPQQRDLHVPAARDRDRQVGRDVHAEEGREPDKIVNRQNTGQHLNQKKRGGHGEEFVSRALQRRRSEASDARHGDDRMRAIRAVEADPFVSAPVNVQHAAERQNQSEQTEDAPERH